MAFAGAALGAFCVYAAGQGAKVEAARRAAPPVAMAGRGPVADGPEAAYAARARYVGALIAHDAGFGAGGQQRLVAPEVPRPHVGREPAPPRIVEVERPKIIIIFDDMGPDRSAFEQLMALPGPLTFSFLPYAEGLQPMADRARARGDAVMLHLPMQPVGRENPGRRHLRTDMTGTELLSALAWNLKRFDGYVGVNNHMGSAFTADLAGMKTVLAVLEERGLFFLDSLTTARSRAAQAGRAVDAEVYTRDVFLDPDLDRETVFAQLQIVERIARDTGYAVAIAHPRDATIDVIGPWLTTAPARGFDLATIEFLRDVNLTLAERDRARPRQAS